MRSFIEGAKKFIKDENGLTTAEWVILASAIAVAAIGVLAVIIPRIKTMANDMDTKLGGYDSSNPTEPQ